MVAGRGAKAAVAAPAESRSQVPLVARSSDQLESLRYFGHCAYTSSLCYRNLLFNVFLCFVMYCNFFSNLFK